MTKETKMATREDAGATAEMMAAFEAYKETNDQRLSEIEGRGAADPLLKSKLKKLDRRINEISLKVARPEQGQAERAQFSGCRDFRRGARRRDWRARGPGRGCSFSGRHSWAEGQRAETA